MKALKKVVRGVTLAELWATALTFVIMVVCYFISVVNRNFIKGSMPWTEAESIKQELNIMCVLYTEDVGGILMVFYDEDGNLEFRVDHEENDFSFDEIGSVLKIKQLQQTKQELFESLELFYKVFYLGEEVDLEEE